MDRCLNKPMISFSMIYISFNPAKNLSVNLLFYRWYRHRRRCKSPFSFFMILQIAKREGLAAPLFCDGRQTEYAQQSRKKKTMKTSSQKTGSGLKSRSA
jgi:hypothetical protein